MNSIIRFTSVRAIVPFAAFTLFIYCIIVPVAHAVPSIPAATFGNEYRITGGADSMDATIDGAGHLYVAYDSGGSVYLRKDRGDAELVSAGTSPAIAVDSAGNVHIIYTNGGLQYKKRTGAIWSAERSVPAGTVFYSIDTDSSGAAHIAADDGGTGGRGHIVYIKDEGGSWSAPIWEATGWYDSGSGNYYHQPVIKIDSDDHYHLAYEADNWGGKASWSDRSINIASDSSYGSNGVGGFNWNSGVGLTRHSLALNGAEAYITYTNGGTQNIADVTGTWTVLDSFSGSSGAIFAKNGVIGIAYVDGTVKYMESSGPGFTTPNDFGSGSTPVALLGSRHVFYQNGTDVMLQTSDALAIPTATLTVVKHVNSSYGGSKTAGDFTIYVTPGGSFPGSESPGNTMTGLAPGTYTVSEDQLPGYSASIGGDCDGSGSITLAGGDNKTCVVTNAAAPGQLIITKTTVGGDRTFSFSLSGPTGVSPSITTESGSGTYTNSDLAAGTYSLSETVPSGWSLTSASCDDGASSLDGSTLSGIVIGNGETVHCTIVDTKLASIEVHKYMLAPNGETQVSDNKLFTVALDGGSERSLSAGSYTTYSDLALGAHSIAETQDPDYGAATYGGDCAADGSITLSSGQDATCTITNTQLPAHLTVIKRVNTPNGGTAVPSDFTMSVSGTNVSQSSFPGNDITGTTVTLDPGTFSVSEDGPEGYYLLSADGDCKDTAASNASLTCTLTNSDIPSGKGVITVIKSVINDNGGTLQPQDFTVHVLDASDGNVSGSPASGSSSGSSFTLDPGTYTVGELDPTAQGYAETGISCQRVSGGADPSGSSVTLTIGDQDAYICTITNNDIVPSLTLQKTVANEYGGKAQAGDWTLSAGSATGVLQGVGPTVESGDTLQAGRYTLSEAPTDDSSSVTNGYENNGWRCTGTGTWSADDPLHVTLGIGQSETCGITNSDQPAHLTLVKKTDAESGGGTFYFAVNETTPDGMGTQTMNLSTAEGNGYTATGETMDLPRGGYNITETDVPVGWHLADASCTVKRELVETTSIENGLSLSLENGDDAVCTFTNTKRGTLIVKKVVVNDNNGAAVASDFSFTMNGGEATAFGSEGRSVLIVDPGTYSVREVAADGYTASYENCADIEVAAGGEATCTITNDDVAPTPTPTGGGSSGNGPIVGSGGGGGSLPTALPNNGGAAPGETGQVLGASTSTAPAEGVSCSALLTAYLRRGGHNEAAQVKLLQGFLNDEMSSGLPTTGYFGPLTEAAVKAFQLKYAAEVLAPWGLSEPTGYVGRTTEWKINMIHCPSLALPAPAIP